jgi:putative transposase
MDEYESLSHTRWECKYHVVFIPKYRRKTLYGELRRHLGEVFRKLAVQKESKIEEGHLMPDHTVAHSSGFVPLRPVSGKPVTH